MRLYLYEQLSPEKFQQLCQALITSEFPNAQSLPVAQPDGGRDAVAWRISPHLRRVGEFVAFQVKFSRNPERPSEDFFADILEKEMPKIERLKGRGMKAYYLITNVKGTAHLGY